jgi:hypothetical protein
MTTDKAQKREIRARMSKTGERYTAARHHLLGEHLPSPESDAQAKPELAIAPRVAEPGMSEEAVQRATGRTWDEWLATLEPWGAANRSHTEIARHVAEDYGIGGWWAQSVTVGYERMRGKRAVHQVTGGFSVNVSKTFPVSVNRLFEAFVDETQRDRWLEYGTLRLRTAQEGRSARFDVGDGRTRLEAIFTGKGPEKASVALQVSKLISADEVEAMRAAWRARLSHLAEVLAGMTGG